MNDLIDRQAALDALGERPVVWSDNDDYTLGERNQYDMDRLAIETVPSAQPGQRNARVFQGIIVEYPSISAYPEYEGKPYFLIKYTVNGQKFIGYGTYKLEVLSEYLKEYFMPLTQPGCEDAVPRASVEYICRKNTVSTNPYEHKYHDKFIQFMDDPEISDFGRWQHSNGFNTALVAVKCDLDKVPSVTPKPWEGEKP